MAAPIRTVKLLNMKGFSRILSESKNGASSFTNHIERKQLFSIKSEQKTDVNLIQTARRLVFDVSTSLTRPRPRPNFRNSRNAASSKPKLRTAISVNLTPCHHHGCRNFSTSPGSSFPHDPDDRSSDPAEPEHPLRLMNFTERLWPHPIKSIRNMFMAFLISGYMERNFTSKKFLDGAEQAIALVSRLISLGKFDELDGLVTKDAIHEIRQHYNILDSKQKQMLAVDPRDLFYRFVYEIGMIFDDQTEKRFVEITAVFQGYHGLAEMRDRGEPQGNFQPDVQQAGEHVYVCNYRFIREYTKEVTDSTDWTINKLNHFSPKDIVKSTGFFSR